MSHLDLKDISEIIRKIDICMMGTLHDKGRIESRPMSNNRDVNFEGDCHFFALQDSGAVVDIKQNPQTCLSYVGDDHTYVSISGKSDLIKR